MSLDFGIFDHLDRNDLPLRDYYEERLKLIEARDRAGFYGYPSPSTISRRLAWRPRQRK